MGETRDRDEREDRGRGRVATPDAIRRAAREVSPDVPATITEHAAEYLADATHAIVRRLVELSLAEKKCDQRSIHVRDVVAALRFAEAHPAFLFEDVASPADVSRRVEDRFIRERTRSG